jgi:hypothetical protein
VSKYFLFFMLMGTVTGIRTLSFSPTCYGLFWEDDAQIKSLHLTIVLFPKQFEEFGFYFFPI